jgi:tetratricopeptide (TPR) repeat protein
MRYDRLGFPVPAEFDLREERRGEEGAAPRRPTGRKRFVVGLLLLGIGLPLAVGSFAMPLVRETAADWLLERAARHEVNGRPEAAAAVAGQALAWCGDDAELLCRVAALQLEARDADAAVATASRALALAPTSPQPARVRGLAHAVRGDAEAALSDAALVVDLSSPHDPDALNHRAYVRALMGRDLPAALADIDAALAAVGGDAPEMLDTRGFVLHLLGRQQEAVDQLNLAIDGMQQRRRDLAQLVGRIDTLELARRLRWIDQSLAVMLHHRGLACRALGLDGQAEQDLTAAQKKGFDPSRGIF